MIQFVKKDKQVPFFKGVIFGDAGSGKSFLAKDFAVKSCEVTNINKFILIDTEGGWEWLKREIPDNIEILEPKDFQYTPNENIEAENLPSAVELFSAIKKITDDTPVSSVIIDSASHIGKMLYYNALATVNAGKKWKKDDLQFQDWNIHGASHDKVINLIRGMRCNVLLCARATSESALGQEVIVDKKTGQSKLVNKVVDAIERTVLDWKKITYEFDFACLLKPDIDLTCKESFKKFKTIVLKSRFSDDGKVLHNNNFLDKWFQFFEVMDYEKIKTSLLDSLDVNNFNIAKEEAVKFKLQMNREQQLELKNIIENKLKQFNNAE